MIASERTSSHPPGAEANAADTRGPSSELGRPMATAARPLTADHGRRVDLRRRARLRTACVLAAPVALSVALDVGHRASRIAAFDPLHLATYAAAVLESLLVGAALLAAAARRRSVVAWLVGAVFVAALTVSLGAQRYFFQQYSAYLNAEVSSFAAQFRASVVNQVAADLPNYLGALLPALAAGIAMVVAARRWVRLTRSGSRISVALSPGLLVAALFVPTQHRQHQASTPDVLFWNALGGLVRVATGVGAPADRLDPMARQSLPVPPLVVGRAPANNVVLVLLESVRADATCIEHDPGCRKTEYTNRLLPGRVGLSQLRALDSTTAITLAVLWSGLPPTASRERLRTQPLLFDYARAAGYHTAYLTSQSLDFGESRRWVENLGVDRFCDATELDPAADLDVGASDALLVARAERELETLPEPFFAVVHLSNVHYPFLVDPAGPQPFQPASRSKAPADNPAFYNHYLNSVHQQDRHVQRLLAHLIALPAGPRTVVAYTSDHGEAFREHGNMGHTFSVLDEELHVPGWIHAPPGTLTDAERGHLECRRHQPTTHVDLTQTLLDLMGLLDARELGRFLADLPGQSLLRPAASPAPVPLTNCSALWSCPFENWGALQGFRKVEAREWDWRWHCYDLALDPEERHDLGPSACPELVEFASATFRRLPGHAEDGKRSPKPSE